MNTYLISRSVEQKYPSKGFYRVPGVYTFLPTKK
jgi:hypothetical protein